MANTIKIGTAIRFSCAVLFIIFSFSFLYFFQSDILAATQHVLSDGKTVYHAGIGTVCLTLLLCMIQAGVARLSRLQVYSYALTYFPSFLLLAVLTGISTDSGNSFSLEVGWVVPLLLLLAFIFVVYIIRQNQLGNSDKYAARHMRILWVNVLIMGVMMFFTAYTSQTNDTFHYRMKMERSLLDENYAAVNDIGRKALVADSSMTMLRAYALAKQGLLGERLFTYPVAGKSRALLPDSNTVRLVMFPEKKIYRDLGARIKQQTSPVIYLKFINKHHLATQMGQEYLLTACLLDKDLDTFARLIGKYYHINDSLPRHYREALVLYKHRSSSPVVVYNNNVMDADFKDYQKLYQSVNNRVIRQVKLRDSYGNTYWYYYQYN